MTINFDLSSYEELLKDRRLSKSINREKNIFSIGARGHYENPISDIMAFFLDPREEHRFDTLFLQSLFNCINITCPDFSTVLLVEREVVTTSGNRIDILVEGEDWVLVIENKIYHTLSNPLKDYQDFISNKYPSKEKHFFILAIESNKDPEWKGITYDDFSVEIEKELGKYLLKLINNKWLFLLREYLLNIKELGSVKSSMKTT